MVKRVFEKLKINLSTKKTESNGVGAMRAKKTAVKRSARTTSKKVSFKDLSMDELNSLVAMKAYELFEKRGYSNGNDMNDWFEAEKIVKKSLKK